MSNIRVPEINRVEVAGRVVRDPEMNMAGGGMKIANITVCVVRRTMKEGVKKEETVFLPVVSFGKLADNVANTIAKGTPVIVFGRLTQDEWTDKATGAKRTAIKMIADRIDSLEWPDKASDEQPAKRMDGSERRVDGDDDVPF